MQATELANEAYERLVRLDHVGWCDRDHFYAVAATVIRRVVVDHLRRKGRTKRGGGLPLVALHELADDQAPMIEESVDWLSIDEALDGLARIDRNCARVVESDCNSAIDELYQTWQQQEGSAEVSAKLQVWRKRTTVGTNAVSDRL